MKTIQTEEIIQTATILHICICSVPIFIFVGLYSIFFVWLQLQIPKHKFPSILLFQVTSIAYTHFPQLLCLFFSNIHSDLHLWLISKASGTNRLYGDITVFPSHRHYSGYISVKSLPFSCHTYISHTHSSRSFKLCAARSQLHSTS